MDKNPLLLSLCEQLSTFDLSVLLAGSFSRGEETYLCNSHGVLHPLSDLEFIIFQNNNSFLLRNRHNEIRNIMQKLENEFSIKIDFSIKPKMALNFVPRTFFWYETFETGKILVDNLDIKIKKIKVNEIEAGDVVEVLNHAALGIIKAIYSHSEYDPYYLKYSILKRSLDLLIPLLFLNGNLASTHIRRVQKFKNSSLYNHTSLQEIIDLFLIIDDIKIKNRVILENYFDKLETIDLLNKYIKFNEFIYKKFEDKKYESKIPFGSRCLLRYFHITKNAILKPNYCSFIFKLNNVEKVYRQNILFLKKITSCNEFKNSKFEIEDLLNINKIFYRYL